MENRRKNIRIECLFKLKSTVNDRDNTIVAVAKDVSQGGACVLSDIPLPDHPVLMRFFSLDKSRTVEVKSMVVWSRVLQDEFGNYESGIKFLDMDSETNRVFNDLLEDISY